MAYEYSEDKKETIKPTPIAHETRYLHHKKLYELTLNKQKLSFYKIITTHRRFIIIIVLIFLA